MNKNEQQEKIQMVADIVQMLLEQVDMFTSTFTKDDFEILNLSKEELQNKISRNMSALPLIIACGGNYDSLEDKMKLKTLTLLIELIKVRVEFREKLLEKQKQIKNKKEILNLFQI